MALSLEQVPATTSAKPLCFVPPGPCDVVITNSNTTAADLVYVGLSAGVTASNGIPVPASGVLRFQGYRGSAGAQLYVIAVASTGVGVLISTPD